MSRRAGNIPEETRAGLLRAAADEFAEYGFEKSSLRRICTRAGVTTGALYASFRDKEDLFENVISPVTGHICSVLGEHFRRERDSSAEELLAAGGEEHDVQAVMAILRYYFNNRKLCSILFENREHPAVKAFFDRVIGMTDLQTAQVAGVIGQKTGGAEKYELGANTVNWFYGRTSGGKAGKRDDTVFQRRALCSDRKRIFTEDGYDRKKRYGE